MNDVTPSLSVRTINAVTTRQNQLKAAFLEKHLRKRLSELSMKSHTEISTEPLADDMMIV